MNNRKRAARLLCLAPLLFFLSQCGADTPVDLTVQVQSVTGPVKVISRGKTIVPVRGDILNEKDEISTGKASNLDLLIGEYVIIRVRENTRADLSTLLTPLKHEGRFSLLSGKVFVIMTKLKRGSSFKIDTPTTTIAVRGTVFSINADDNKSSIDVLGGKVTVHPVKEGKAIESVAETLRAGRYAEITAKEVPLIAEGKTAIRTRDLTAEEFGSAISELSEISKEVLVNLEPDIQDGFMKEAGSVIRERDRREKKAIEEGRIKARREAEELRKKAEDDAARKKLEEEAAAKKKLEEDRARAQKAAQQKKKDDRSGDVTGIK